MSHVAYCGWYCGQKLTKQNDTKYSCSSQHQVYNNPRAAASALILSESNDKVLLGIRARAPRKGTLDTIGGFINYDEDPKKTAVREVKEETGLDVVIEALLGCYTNLYIEDLTTVSATYVGRTNGGRLQPADDVAESVWIEITHPPDKNTYAWPWMEQMFSDLHAYVRSLK